MHEPNDTEPQPNVPEPTDGVSVEPAAEPEAESEAPVEVLAEPVEEGPEPEAQPEQEPESEPAATEAAEPGTAATEAAEPGTAAAGAAEAQPERAAPDAPDAALVEGVGGGLTWWPYAVYLGLWVVFVALTAYLLYDPAPDTPARFLPAYEPLLLGGLILTALGPVLSLGVWLVARATRPAEARRGLFASAVTRGALATFFGAVLWLGTLFVLDLLASGWSL